MTAHYSLLQACLPGRPAANIGVLLVDPSSDRLHSKLRRDWDAIADPDDAEVFEHLRADLASRAASIGAAALLEELESSLSNAIQITDREAVEVADFRAELNRIFHEHVQKAEVLPFRTHLPVYTLKAAATRFGGDMEVEPADWTEAPEGLRLTGDMFVAQVVGRSMEPLIPDGAYCIFRASATGTRQGKYLLIRHRGVSASGGEYTVKRYTSTKRTGDDGWEHAVIRLEPLNPEFDSFDLANDDEFTVVGEFVRVLE